MHPPKPILGGVVGSRSALPTQRGREWLRSAGSARPAGQPASHPQARADPTAARARAPRHLESKFGPVDGAWRPSVAGGGGGACAVTRPLWPLTPDPWNVHSFNGAASASGAESRLRGACALGGGGARGPRPRAHVTRLPREPAPGGRDPRAVARAGREGARGASRGAAAPSRKGSEKRRVDSILGLRARPLLVKLQGTGGACVLPKTHASVKALAEEFK